MSMSERILSKECKKRGFIQRGKSYMRVTGDGIFQHVLCGFKERLHSTAPQYSRYHRYEPRTLIYLKSMYAQYDELLISIDHTTGFSLTVPQLLDKQKTAFMGASLETERMLNEGLDILDTITEQHQIIEYLEPFQYDKRENRQGYSTQLYDTYLYCEEFYKARMAIQTEFAQTYFAIMSNCKTCPDLFSGKLQHFQNGAESYYERYMLTFPVHYDAAKDRLQKNFEVNSKRLEEIGVLLKRKTGDGFA